MKDVYFTDEGAFERTWNSESQAHRQEIMAELERLQPWQSLLEVGCHVGVNLKMIRDRFPGHLARGMDASPLVLDFAYSKGLGNIELGRISTWTDYEFDIILSCYTLFYVSPYWIRDILRRMMFGVKKAIIIAEPMVDSESMEAQLKPPEPGWAHAYTELMGDLESGLMTRRPITPVGNLNGIVVWEKTQ